MSCQYCVDFLIYLNFSANLCLICEYGSRLVQPKAVFDFLEVYAAYFCLNVQCIVSLSEFNDLPEMRGCLKNFCLLCAK